MPDQPVYKDLGALASPGTRANVRIRLRGVANRHLTLFAVLLPCCLASAQERPATADTGATSAAASMPAVQDKRAFGLLPNYRTADGNAPFVAISTRQKFNIATKDTFDYPSYGLAAAFAGISQASNDNPSFGQGAKGYMRRYASAVGDQDLGNYMTEAIFPSMLHEDPRYFRRGHGSFLVRMAYAASRVTVTKTDEGKPRFNSSEFLGNGVVASIGNLYYPDDTGLRYTAQRMFMQIGTDAFDNVLKEFWPDVKRRLLKGRGE